MCSLAAAWCYRGSYDGHSDGLVPATITLNVSRCTLTNQQAWLVLVILESDLEYSKGKRVKSDCAKVGVHESNHSRQKNNYGHRIMMAFE